MLSMRLDEDSLGKIMGFVSKHARGESIISRDGGTIRVNDMLITKKGNQWQVIKNGTVLMHFSFRSWALAYAVAQSSGNEGIDSYLANNEQRLCRLLADKQIYDHHYSNSIERGDTVKASIIEHRLSRTDREINQLLDSTQQVVVYQRFA